MTELGAAAVVDSTSEQTIAAKLGLPGTANLGRKEKRKQLKKLRRKQIRQQVAEEKLKESTGLDDTADELRSQREEQMEAERLANEKAEHDEQERLWLEREKIAMEDFQKQQEELRIQEEERTHEDPEEDSEYVDDDGPAEIIWIGNEIIVKKKRVKAVADPPASVARQDTTQEISNPLPPQSAAFAAHNKNPQTPGVSEQTTVFGTEQDKTHCPFHIKTGVCRFGVRCSRVHVYPDHSLTLLVRNMYTGPGLAWEIDEGLEHSDEEVAQHYEEFYEDVHSEFLQFGELVNFKVCNNASSHLRGNLYVHYKDEASAQAAYSALNGRFYAGKQITCEFVGVTRWRVALCGEYMKGNHRLCSRGSACNFLHCFRNPRGEYDWANWDAHRPRSWVAKMAKRFGYENDLEHERDYEFHDDGRTRRRSPRSPYRESRHSEHRSRDRHHHSSRDDRENSGRHREHKRSENGRDDSGRSSRHRAHLQRDINEVSSSKELDERSIRNDRETTHDSFASEIDSGATDYHDLRADTGEQQHKRLKSRSGDVQREAVERFTRESRRVNSRDRSFSSNRSLQDTDDDCNYRRHRSRDYRDSDRRQSLDLRSSKNRSKVSERLSPTNQIESKTKDEALKDYSEKEVHRRKLKNGRSTDGSGSSDISDVEQRHNRRRSYLHTDSEARSSRRKKRTQENVTVSQGGSPDIDDRWTGVSES